MKNEKSAGIECGWGWQDLPSGKTSHFSVLIDYFSLRDERPCDLKPSASQPAPPLHTAHFHSAIACKELARDIFTHIGMIRS